MTEETEEPPLFQRGVTITALFFGNVEAEHVCLIRHGADHLQSNNNNVSSNMIAPHTYVSLSNTHNSLNCGTTESLSGCKEGNNIAI